VEVARLHCLPIEQLRSVARRLRRVAEAMKVKAADEVRASSLEGAHQVFCTNMPPDGDIAAISAISFLTIASPKAS